MVLRREFRRLCGSTAFVAGFVVPLAFLSAVVAVASYFCYALVLKPLPYQDGDRIVVVRNHSASGDVRPSSGREFGAWAQHSRLLQSAAIAAPRSLLRWTTTDGRIEALQGVAVSPGFFEVFAAAPVIGRLPGFALGSSEVVIGWRMWRTHLGGRDDVLGMTLNLADTPMVVTGVMPQRFDAPRIVYPAWTPPDVWMAHPSVPESDARTPHVLGRLAPGATVAAAEAELRALADSFAVTPGRAPFEPRLTRVQDVAVERTREILRATTAGAAVLLLLGLVNAVPLYLTRIFGRIREVSTLSAMGASRRRILAMFAVETALLALAVGAVAAVLSSPLLAIVIALAPQQLTRLSEVRVGGDVLASAALLGIAATLMACGLAGTAAFRALSASLIQLREPATARRAARVRGVLLCGQVALSVALVAGAVLLARTAFHLQTVDRGFEPRGLTKVGFWLPPGGSGADALRLLPAMTPDHESGLAAIATSVPGTPAFRTISVRRDGEEVAFGSDAVSSSYFGTVGLRLVAGRPHRDDSESEIVIDTSVARWLGQDPNVLPGQTVHLFGKPRVVAGVAERVVSSSLEPGRPMVYSSYFGEEFPAGFLFVRSSARTASLASIHKRTAAEFPGVMFFGYESVWDRLTREYERQWFLLAAGVMAAGVAVVMTVVGIAGFVMYLFRGRRRELAIRAAVGATPSQLRWLSVRSVGLSVACGAVLGIPLAIACEALLRSVLMGPAAAGPANAIGVALLLMVLAFLACVLIVRESDLATLTAQLQRDT